MNMTLDNLSKYCIESTWSVIDLLDSEVEEKWRQKPFNDKITTQIIAGPAFEHTTLGMTIKRSYKQSYRVKNN